MLKRWGHPLTLNELFGREVTKEDREELKKIVMMRPISGWYADGKLPESLIQESYEIM